MRAVFLLWLFLVGMLLFGPCSRMFGWLLGCACLCSCCSCAASIVPLVFGHLGIYVCFWFGHCQKNHLGASAAEALGVPPCLTPILLAPPQGLRRVFFFALPNVVFFTWCAWIVLRGCPPPPPGGGGGGSRKYPRMGFLRWGRARESGGGWPLLPPGFPGQMPSKGL